MSFALAAFLKPLIGPVMVFAGLLLARWIAIVILRLLPDGRARQVLFDKGLFDRRPGLYAALFFASVVSFYTYAASFH